MAQLDYTEFPSSIEWSFAKDVFVKEGDDYLSYDDLEDRDEGEAHRWLREIAKESLEKVGFKVYDGGVGIKGHNGFCDGAAKRTNEFVVFEALRRWAIMDDEQLLKKLEFAKYCNLLLLSTRKDRKLLKLKIKRLASNLPNPVVLAYPIKSETGKWSLHISWAEQLSTVAMFQESAKYTLQIAEKRTWAEFSIEAITSTTDNLFLDNASRLIWNFYGKKGGGVNNRSKNRRPDTAEFIIRNNGKEIARFVRTGFGVKNVCRISGRIKRSDLPDFIELFSEFDRKGSIELNLIYI